MSDQPPATPAMLAMNQLVESESDNTVSLVAGLSPVQQTAFAFLTRGGTISADARAINADDTRAAQHCDRGIGKPYSRQRNVNIAPSGAYLPFNG